MLKNKDKFHYLLLLLLIVLVTTSLNSQLKVGKNYKEGVQYLYSIVSEAEEFYSAQENISDEGLWGDALFFNRLPMSTVAPYNLYLYYEHVFFNISLGNKVESLEEELNQQGWSEQAEEYRLMILKDMKFLKECFSLMIAELGDNNLRWYHELGSGHEKSALKKKIVEIKERYREAAGYNL